MKLYPRNPIGEGKRYKTSGTVDCHISHSGSFYLSVFFPLFLEETFRKIKGPENAYGPAGKIALTMMGEFHNIGTRRFIDGAKVAGKAITQFAYITGLMEGCL